MIFIGGDQICVASVDEDEMVEGGREGERERGRERERERERGGGEGVWGKISEKHLLSM